MIDYKKTNAMNNCAHVKVWSNNILTSNPPQRDWICSRCGERGRSRGQYQTQDLYSDLVKMFANANDPATK